MKVAIWIDFSIQGGYQDLTKILLAHLFALGMTLCKGYPMLAQRSFIPFILEEQNLSYYFNQVAITLVPVKYKGNTESSDSKRARSF